jgi:hypothetical protein
VSSPAGHTDEDHETQRKALRLVASKPRKERSQTCHKNLAGDRRPRKRCGRQALHQQRVAAYTREVAGTGVARDESRKGSLQEGRRVGERVGASHTPDSGRATDKREQGRLPREGGGLRPTGEIREPVVAGETSTESNVEGRCSTRAERGGGGSFVHPRERRFLCRAT